MLLSLSLFSGQHQSEFMVHQTIDWSKEEVCIFSFFPFSFLSFLFSFFFSFLFLAFLFSIFKSFLLLFFPFPSLSNLPSISSLVFNRYTRLVFPLWPIIDSGRTWSCHNISSYSEFSVIYLPLSCLLFGFLFFLSCRFQECGTQIMTCLQNTTFGLTRNTFLTSLCSRALRFFLLVLLIMS